MTYKLFIDDERDPITNDWVIARNAEQAIQIVFDKGCPKEIAFDHDLGETGSVIPFVDWIILKDIEAEGTFIPRNFEYTIHSQNPIGVGNIRGKLDQYLEFRDD